jgi:hypothetical protein
MLFSSVEALFEARRQAGFQTLLEGRWLYGNRARLAIHPPSYGNTTNLLWISEEVHLRVL